MYDLVIKNGKVVNFILNKLSIMDVAIKDGKIAAIEKNLDSAKQIIDAKGNIVSPGFIDIHMHEEVIDNNNSSVHYDIGNKMLKMGVTTCVGGNCGDNYMSVKDFFNIVDKNGSPVNYMLYVGHNYYRKIVGVNRYEEATKHQIAEMKRLIRKDIVENGAIGLSFGIEYAPGISFEEIIVVCDGIKDLDVLLSAHFRSDGEKGVLAVKEMIKISEITGLPMQISHLGSCTATGQMEESLDVIKDAIDKGIDVRADCYPYDAFSTYIGSTVFDDGCFEKWGKDYSDVLLTEEPYKNISCTKEIFNEVRNKFPDMLVVAFVMNEYEIIDALRKPFVYPASDGLLNKGQGHPRAAGTFPRIIGKYVREEGKLNLIDQLKKMSKLPAKRLKLDQKGDIQVGKDGDIVIFDYDRIIDCATFENPTEPPHGIEYVLIDGKIAVKDGEIVEKRLGKSIKRAY